MSDVSFPFAEVGIVCLPASYVLWTYLVFNFLSRIPTVDCPGISHTPVSIFEGWLGSSGGSPPLVRLHGVPTGHFWVSVQSYHHSAGLSMPLAMGHCPLGPGKRAGGAFPTIKDSRPYQKILQVPNCDKT